MLELDLVEQKEKTIDIEGIKVKLAKSNPMLQANLINVMEGVNTADMIKHVEIMSYFFENIVETVTYKGTKYKGDIFFSMIKLTDSNTQTFMAKLMSEIIGVFFLSEKSKKK